MSLMELTALNGFVVYNEHVVKFIARICYLHLLLCWFLIELSYVTIGGSTTNLQEENTFDINAKDKFMVKGAW